MTTARSGAIRVVIADDHPLMRAGLSERLTRGATGIEVVAEAADGEEACEVVARTEPHVVLLDISMPRLSGIDATRRIKACSPEVAVLILTAYDDEQYVVALMDAGADGYLLKTTDGAALADAVRRVRRGETVLSPAITARIIERIAAGGRAPVPVLANPLSGRELQVLGLAARGASDRSIAGDLEVSVRTVNAHMRNILGKLGAGSRTEAVMLAARHGWLASGRDDADAPAESSPPLA